MNYSTIPKTKFFNTGFLRKDTIDEMRLNQNLMTQRVSNYCDHLYTVCPCHQKTCKCQRNSDSLLINSATPLPTYGWKPMNPNLDCLRWVHPN
jgi:hypothetical protein